MCSEMAPTHSKHSSSKMRSSKEGVTNRGMDGEDGDSDGEVWDERIFERAPSVRGIRRAREVHTEEETEEMSFEITYPAIHVS